MLYGAKMYLDTEDQKTFDMAVAYLEKQCKPKSVDITKEVEDNLGKRK